MKHVKGQWRATVRVQRRGPGAKTTEVEARVALVGASTDDGRPLTGGSNLVWTVVDWVASGTGPCINGRYLTHNFGVATLAALAGEMAGICDTYIYLW